MLDSLEVLKLNKQHEPIFLDTPRRTFGDLASYLDSGKRKLLAYDIQFYQREDGSYIFPGDLDYSLPKQMQLVDWDDWITLPIRSYDLYVSTAKTKIRVPRVVVSPNYADMPIKRHRLNFHTVYEIYKGICAYTKRKLTKAEANLDHVVPKSKGGKHTWGNVVLCDKRVNNKKGSKLPKEAGLPDVSPIVPQPLPSRIYLNGIYF
jgi:5-methylcytosine-specific restriction endonuclease McrA